MPPSSARPRRLTRAPGAWLGVLLLFLFLAAPAHAQLTLDAQVGLNGYVRPHEWTPLRIQLANQGAAVRAEVRARYSEWGDQQQALRIDPRTVQSGASEQHHLYFKAGGTFSPQPMEVDLLAEGRLLNRVHPPVTQVAPGEWLALAVTTDQSTLRLLRAVSFRSHEIAPRVRESVNSMELPRAHVAVARPEMVPDRWQGLAAADLIALGDVTERAFTAEQLAALREYVVAGGHLVVAGGLNFQRLDTEFFAELLPVRITGTWSAATLPGLVAPGSPFAPRARSDAASYGPPRSGDGALVPLTAAELKPGAERLAGQDGRLLAATHTYGGGRVSFLAFDPDRPPFTNWEGTPEIWRRLLRMPPGGYVARVVSSRVDAMWPGRRAWDDSASVSRLAAAPYRISQLDMPSFYLVALVLLAYIVVLVPVNYSLLKARDRRELAWLTTPLIVLAFSAGAYGIGYAHKGGRALVSQVSVIETQVGSSQGQQVLFAGLFSPRRASYTVEPGSPGMLLIPADVTRQGQQQSYSEAGSQRLAQFDVDMWAMRVVEGSQILPLGDGFSADWSREEDAFRFTITNGTPLALEGCFLVADGLARSLGDLAPGGSVSGTYRRQPVQPADYVLPMALRAEMADSAAATSELRAAMLRLLTETPWNLPSHLAELRYPLLIGWVREPPLYVQVDGRAPRKQSAELVVVHLNSYPGTE